MYIYIYIHTSMNTYMNMNMYVYTYKRIFMYIHIYAPLLRRVCQAAPCQGDFAQRRLACVDTGVIYIYTNM